MSTEEPGKSFASRGQDIADKTAGQVQSGINTARDTANKAADRLSHVVEQGRSKTGPTIQKASDTLGAAHERVRATAGDVRESVVSYAKDNPIQSLLMSMAVGAVLGSWLTASRRRRI